MTARIMTDDGWYDSIVFAMYDTKECYEALVFDKTLTKLTRVKMSESHIHTYRKVFIYDVRVQDWVEREGEEGYEWILSASDFNEVMDRCKQLQDSVRIIDFFEPKDDDDLRGLMRATVDFHDAYVGDMFSADDKQYILFHAWSIDVLFELEGDVETNLIKGYGNMLIGDDYPLILGSLMFKENGRYCWTDYEAVTSFEELERAKPDIAYFAANNVRWTLTPRNDR